MRMSEQELRNALRALAVDGAPREAPPAVEQRLLEAFRRKQQARWWRVARIAGAMAGAGIAAGLAVMYWIPSPPPKPEARMIVPAPPAVVASAPAPVAAALAPRKVARRSVRLPRPQAPPSAVPEVATKFYALPDADIFAPVEDATVIRVQLPRSAMRMVGLPVNEDRASERIRADVVLGQDGIARAVRFVQ
jgi:hypothetical protein